MNRSVLYLLVLACLAVSTHRAHAHAIGVDCRLVETQIAVAWPMPFSVWSGPGSLIPISVVDRQVVVEAFYSDNTSARSARVELYDDEGKLLERGRADGRGVCRFQAPAPGAYRVVVNAGAGHRSSQSITIPGNDGGTSPSRSGTHINSDGPTREEFTRFPWLNVIIGLSIIATVALVVLLARRADRTGQTNQAASRQ